MTPRRRGDQAMRRLAGLAIAALAVAACASVGAGDQSTGPSATAAPRPSEGLPESPSSSDTVLPTLLPDSVLDRVPTRVRVPALGIDLPVVSPPSGAHHFPYCNVAEYLPRMSRPGRPGTTFLYAHARPGMFLPILEASHLNGGRSLVGLRVDVFASDDRRFTYEVVDVLRHVVSLDFAYRETAEQLILQTSEGPSGTAGKTMLIALPRGEAVAGPAEARPTADPVPCR
jgi:hypothetical protein